MNAFFHLKCILGADKNIIWTHDVGLDVPSVMYFFSSEPGALREGRPGSAAARGPGVPKTKRFLEKSKLLPHENFNNRNQPPSHEVRVHCTDCSGEIAPSNGNETKEKQGSPIWRPRENHCVQVSANKSSITSRDPPCIVVHRY